MKRILLAAGLLLCACSLFGRSRVVTDTLSSKILGRDVYINVYIPDGFDQAPEQTYPALYLLHGLYGTHLNWVETGGLDVVLDELIGTGEAARMVVIMPCAGDPDIHHVQNGYFNVKDNPYEDFFFSEMMPSTIATMPSGIATYSQQQMTIDTMPQTIDAMAKPFGFSSCGAP